MSNVRRIPLPGPLRAPSPADIERELDMIELLQAMNGIQTEFVATVRGMQANGVLFSGSFQLDANGLWHKSFPVPFAYVYVGPGQSPMTVTNQPPQTGPPPFGPGVFPASGYAGLGFNMAGRSLTIYGTPGDAGIIEVDVKPHPPTVTKRNLPTVMGPPYTVSPALQTSAAAMPAVNSNILYRSMGAGSISGIALQVGTASGNIAVGIYQGPGGAGYSPMTRLAWSGVIACPAGPATIPIAPAPVAVNLNCFFCIAADNTVATFFSAGGGWGGGYAPNAYTAGLCLTDSGSPGVLCPPTITVNAGIRGVAILMTGI